VGLVPHGLIEKDALRKTLFRVKSLWVSKPDLFNPCVEIVFCMHEDGAKCLGKECPRNKMCSFHGVHGPPMGGRAYFV
jgi:hypothetical protein